MIKNVLIIYRVNRSDRTNSGIVNKLTGQIAGLSSLGIKADYVIHDEKNIYLNSKIIYTRKKKVSDYWFNWKFFDYLEFTESTKYDLYIIRYGLTTLSFIRKIRRFRDHNPKCLILLDMPTYPYKKEWSGIAGNTIYQIDRRLRKKLASHVDYIMHSGNEEQLFSIPTVPFSNGINISFIKGRQIEKHSGYKLLAIGKWQYWHGLDRLILGLEKYAKQGGKDITIDIIGEGPSSNYLKKLVGQLALQEFVFFRGVCTGDKLDSFFNKADLGIGTLGLHRKNVLIDSSLKHREYVARGLPFVLSSPDSDITVEEKFVLKVDPDESIIEINELKNFVDNCDTEVQMKIMKRLAMNDLSWNVKMKNLISFLENRL